MKLSREEQETIIRYEPTSQIWFAYSSVPKHIRKFKLSHWELIREDECGAEFRATGNAITIRDINKPKKEYTDEQKQQIAVRLHKKN